jgi:regulator of RNase E activity RraA
MSRHLIVYFAKGKCAKSGTKDKVGSTREKIQCGGVEVNLGDIIFADVDGVVMSKDEAAAAITKGEEIQEKEELALKKIQSGARFNQICNIDEHVNNIKEGISSKLRLTV